MIYNTSTAHEYARDEKLPHYPSRAVHKNVCGLSQCIKYNLLLLIKEAITYIVHNCKAICVSQHSMAAKRNTCVERKWFRIYFFSIIHGNNQKYQVKYKNNICTCICIVAEHNR